MLSRLATLALILQQPAAPPLQEPAVQRHVDLTRSFALELPSGWRQLTPDEAFTLSQRPGEVPAELLTPRQAEYYPYGAIDRWLASEFDGRCMTVASRRGEISTDAAGVEVLRAYADKVTRESGWQQEILAAEIASIGPGAHPAIVCRTRTVPGPDARPSMALVLCVPAGGDTLILSFRSWEPDFAAALPMFERAAATLTFARPARGSSSIGDRLLYPAMVGACVGLLLLILRRKAPPRV